MSKEEDENYVNDINENSVSSMNLLHFFAHPTRASI